MPPFVLDYAERKLKLGIELDGPSHLAAGAGEKDAARTLYLANKGWTIIRFSNADVIEDIEAVVEAIWLKAMEISNER